MKFAILCSLALLAAPAASVAPRSAAGTQQSGQVVIGQNTSDHDKEEARRHNLLGNEALHTEKYEEAEREFQTAIKLDPAYELPRYGLGQTYMAMKRYPAAITAFKGCRDVFHANAAADATDDVKRQRRVNDLIDDLENQKRTYQNPGHGGTLASQQVREYIQEIDARLTTLKEERSRNTTTGDQPTPAWLSLGLGSAYFRTDDYANAEREFRNAIQVNPKLGEAHNNLAVLLFVTGRPADASTEITAAEKAGFKVNPALKDDVKKALGKTN
jgi:Flp pilus assembly protein TadD